METRIVRTKDELKAAVDDKVSKIVVKGDLADKLDTGLKIRKASGWAVGLLVASVCAAPLTGGMTIAAAAPVAALTGIEIAVIIAVCAVGVSLVLLICKSYKKVSFKMKTANVEAELVLENS